MVFVGKYITKQIKDIISKQTRLNQQKLQFMKYAKENNIDNDICQLICDRIDSKLIIINGEL